MAARLTAFLVAIIVGISVVAGLIVGAQREAEPAVDVLVYNGRVYTGDPNAPIAEAVAIRGNRILKIGVEPRDQAAAPQRRDGHRCARRLDPARVCRHLRRGARPGRRHRRHPPSRADVGRRRRGRPAGARRAGDAGDHRRPPDPHRRGAEGDAAAHRGDPPRHRRPAGAGRDRAGAARRAGHRRHAAWRQAGAADRVATGRCRRRSSPTTSSRPCSSSIAPAGRSSCTWTTSASCRWRSTSSPA